MQQFGLNSAYYFVSIQPCSLVENHKVEVVRLVYPKKDSKTTPCTFALSKYTILGFYWHIFVTMI